MAPLTLEQATVTPEISQSQEKTTQSEAHAATQRGSRFQQFPRANALKLLTRERTQVLRERHDP